jgi:hypothetical protein
MCDACVSVYFAFFSGSMFETLSHVDCLPALLQGIFDGPCPLGAHVFSGRLMAVPACHLCGACALLGSASLQLSLLQR